MLALLGVCFALVIVSFGIRYWRRVLRNPVTKKLSTSWSSASFWFGAVGMVLVVCRVEAIQFLAMRALWGMWLLAGVLYVIVQVISFRRRHYTVLEKMQVVDERDKYLPRKK